MRKLYIFFRGRKAKKKKISKGHWYIIFFVICFLLLLKSYSIVTLKPGSGSVQTVKINFLVPMINTSGLEITVNPEIPETQVVYNIKWVSPVALILRIEQKGQPQGQLLSFTVEAPTIFPLINKKAEGKVRPKLTARIIKTFPSRKIPTRGPLLITFNTQVDHNSLKKSIILPVPGRLKPIGEIHNGKRYIDYSVWSFIPDQPLKNDSLYQISIKPGLRSLGGAVTPEKQTLDFMTAIKPRVLNADPAQGKRIVLYKTISFTLDQKLSTASIRINDLQEKIVVPGKTLINNTNKTVIFKPYQAFMPDTTYKVVLNAESEEGEPIDQTEINFTTIDLGEKIWVDVSLEQTQTLTVYKGRKKIRQMLASGGKPETPTPLGFFYTGDRGYNFFSYKFGEGANYWVRIFDQILVHSVPTDRNGKIKQDEHEKLGLPASHGCIRLSEEDAKWFFLNIPYRTMVIIHQ